MDTNLTLEVDNNGVEIYKGHAMVGGVRQYGNPNAFQIFGFTETEGPWSCGKFPDGDMIARFPQTSEALPFGHYQVEDAGLGVSLDLRGTNVKDNYVLVNFRDLGGYQLDVVGPHEVGVAFGSLPKGKIWSRLENGTLPGPQNERAANSIQVCGISDMGEIRKGIEGVDQTYKAVVEFYTTDDPETHRTTLRFRGESTSDIYDRMISASRSVDEILGNRDHLHTRMFDLVAKIRREVERGK
tara:strand:- start:168 stop:890 length:723 start_codon:yes stop_codon:yes gene_type:complete